MSYVTKVIHNYRHTFLVIDSGYTHDGISPVKFQFLARTGSLNCLSLELFTRRTSSLELSEVICLSYHKHRAQKRQDLYAAHVRNHLLATGLKWP